MGHPYNENSFAVYQRFQKIGWETVLFSVENIPAFDHPEDVVVEGIGTVRKAFKSVGIETKEIDYPETIKRYLGRKTWKSTVNEARKNALIWPVFIVSEA